jgi:hypothetical protein
MSTIKKRRKRPRRGRLGPKDMELLRREVFDRDKNRCKQEYSRVSVFTGDTVTWFCNRPVTWESGELCHRVSRGAGGHDTAENTFCGCKECHRRFHTCGPSMQKPVPSKRN